VDSEKITPELTLVAEKGLVSISTKLYQTGHQF